MEFVKYMLTFQSRVWVGVNFLRHGNRGSLLYCCINHCTHMIFGTNYEQGGNESFGVHCPTKTAPLECDVKRRRFLDVPAVASKKAGASEPARLEGRPELQD